jgi:hypothetical protein
VIEYVSGQCQAVVLTGGSLLFPKLLIEAVTGGVTNFHGIAIPFAVPLAPGVQETFWQLGQLVKIYADPGTNVTLVVPSSNPCSLAFSGLLVTP